MNKVLINFAHPAKSRSRINLALRRAVENLEGVTVNDLYASYPDFLIDVKEEQRKCEEHDVIIFQHPLYWFSTPSILKEWQDLVLEHGWAFGSGGCALEGKTFVQALTAGGEESSYQKDGYNIYTMNEIVIPFHAMANLCKMKWLPPFAVFGIHRGLDEEILNSHAEEYRRAVIALRDGRIDSEVASNNQYLNSDLDSVIRRAI